MRAANEMTTPAESVEQRALTPEQIERGWQDTFSTNNPFCPCDLRSFTKAVRWAERAAALRSAEAGAVLPAMQDAIEAGDGTLQGSINYWQERALKAEQHGAQEAVAWEWEYVGKHPYPRGLRVARSVKEMDPVNPPYPDTWKPVRPLFTTPQPAVDVVDYVLLRIGDVTRAGDQALNDDCKTWRPLAGWEIGMKYSAVFVPVRRAILASAQGVQS